jgi:hypothetical protein
LQYGLELRESHEGSYKGLESHGLQYSLELRGSHEGLGSDDELKTIKPNESFLHLISGLGILGMLENNELKSFSLINLSLSSYR